MKNGWDGPDGSRLFLGSPIFGLLAAPGVIAVEGLKFLHIGQGCDGGGRIEYHSVGGCVGENGPVGEACGVGVAGFSEVGPVIHHEFGEGAFRGNRALVIAYDIASVVAMRGPVCVGCVILEVIHAGFAQALPGLKGGPGPGMPGEAGLPEEVLVGPGGLGVSGVLVGFENGVSSSAVAASDGLFENGDGGVLAWSIIGVGPE
jgi:hypothetical protein